MDTSCGVLVMSRSCVAEAERCRCRCCTVIELQLGSRPCHDNVPNLALLLKSWINARFKSLTWSPIQTCGGLSGLPWLPVISCRVLQAADIWWERLSAVFPTCVFSRCCPKRRTVHKTIFTATKTCACLTEVPHENDVWLKFVSCSLFNK